MAVSGEGKDTKTFKVVVNHEAQYSIWPADRANPPGWRDAGKSGLKAECLGYIERVWTDMRPLSLRRHPGRAVTDRPVAPAEPASALVDRLCAGDHPVEVSLRPERTVERFEHGIAGGYVLITFTDTEGRTEVRVRLDRERSDLSQADFERHTGTVRLVGTLMLNDVEVRCVASIELPTLTGRGYLEPVEA